ncbi:MAG: hypothetical protein ABH813_01765 [Patescibacteria group bacterium]
MNKKIPTPLVILIILLVIAAIIGVTLWLCREKKTAYLQNEIKKLPQSEIKKLSQNEIKNFEECIVAGYKEVGPRYCVTPDGKIFAEEIQIKSLEEIVSPDAKNLNFKEWDAKEVKVGGWGDSKLILLNKKTEEEKILINSTFELRDYMGQQGFVSGLLKTYGGIFLIGDSEQRNELYFMVSYEFGGPLFSLNINSLKIKEIKEFSWLEYPTFSPEGDMAVSLGKYPATTLYLICFGNDTKTSVVNLKNGETFEQEIRQLDAYFDIEWIDGKTIEYKIYKNEAKDYGDINAFIKEETLQLPDCVL